MNYEMYRRFMERPSEGQNMIKVVSEHTEFVEPNQAIVTLGIVTKNQELSVAQQENNQIADRVIRSLKRLGLSDKQIQTLNYQVYPQYDYENGKQIFSGYEVRQLYKLTINEIDKVGAIIDEVIKSGANMVQNIQFQYSNPTKVYQKALSMAYEKALLKAQTLAKASGQQLFVKPRKIIEQSDLQPVPKPYETTMVKSAHTTTDVQPGQIGITAVINVEFLAG